MKHQVKEALAALVQAQDKLLYAEYYLEIIKADRDGEAIKAIRTSLENIETRIKEQNK